jgi:hypothetical protein
LFQDEGSVGWNERSLVQIERRTSFSTLEGGALIWDGMGFGGRLTNCTHVHSVSQVLQPALRFGGPQLTQKPASLPLLLPTLSDQALHSYLSTKCSPIDLVHVHKCSATVIQTRCIKADKKRSIGPNLTILRQSFFFHWQIVTLRIPSSSESEANRMVIKYPKRWSTIMSTRKIVGLTLKCEKCWKVVTQHPYRLLENKS